MGQRLQLNTILKTISPNVYFQPPQNIQMVYPCIIYKIDDIDQQFADNRTYRGTVKYQVTVVDRNPDTLVPKQLMELLMCSFDRTYTADGLNHFVHSLYY